MKGFSLWLRPASAMCLLLLTSCGYPKDAELRRVFASHPKEFSRLSEMMRQDGAVAIWVELRKADPPAITISSDRWREYQRLCGEVGVERLSLWRDIFELTVKSRGSVSGGDSKGFVYSKRDLSPILGSLDPPLPDQFKNAIEA
jgi:hypothetical protein